MNQGSQTSYQLPTSSLLQQLTTSPTSVTKSAETANWKTYTNAKYGFSLKYPSQWQINPPAIDDGILIGLAEPNEEQIDIEVSPNSPSYTQNNCRKINLDSILATRCETIQQITGERGVTYNSPINSKTVFVVGSHNNLYYSLALTNKESSEKFKIFDQILSTFRSSR